MNLYHSNNIGNVAVLGHLGSGKTSVIEAMAKRAGISQQIGTISQGTAISDYDVEEIKRQSSINLSLIPLEWDYCKINLLDTPGYFDFCGEVISSLRACAAAVIVIDATNPIQVGTEKSLEFTENMPKIMFINKIDNEKARYKDAIDMLREKYDKKIVPMIIPEYKDKTDL